MLDWDLLRKLLLVAESVPFPRKFNVSHYSEKMLHHLCILHQAGLVDLEIREQKREFNPTVEYFLKGLTWKGHEFLSWIHDEELWTEIKITSKQLGIPLTFTTIPKLVKWIRGVQLPPD